MTTVINSPAPVVEAKGNNFLIGVIILIAFVAILLYISIPIIQRMGPVQLKVPAPQVVIPDKIDVNVKQTK